MKSNFTLSLGIGLNLEYDVDNEIEIDVIIYNSEFSHNSFEYVGGVLINVNFNNGSSSIEFSNCTI